MQLVGTSLRRAIPVESRTMTKELAKYVGVSAAVPSPPSVSAVEVCARQVRLLALQRWGTPEYKAARSPLTV